MKTMQRVLAVMICAGATLVFAGYTEAQGTPKASQPASVSQTIGTVLSISLMTMLLNWQQSTNGGSFIEAYRFSYFAAAGIAMLAGVVVLKIQIGRAHV